MDHVPGGQGAADAATISAAIRSLVINATPLLGLARAAGVGCIVDGVGMLVEQAAEAFAWCAGSGRIPVP